LEVFPGKDVLNCYYHTSVNCEKGIKKHVQDKEDRDRMKYDIQQIQLSQSEEVFQKATSLFVKKWEASYKGFTDYFQRQHVQVCGNWYEGKAMFAPSSNNALESNNGKVKKLWTNNKRLPMKEMIPLIAKMLHNWSLDLKEKPFALKPPLTDNDLIEAYIYAKKDVTILPDPDEHEKHSDDESVMKIWWVHNVSSMTPTNRDVRNVKSLNWINFTKFKKVNFMLHKVTTIESKEFQTTPAYCTCRGFYKNFKCVHSLGAAIRMNLLEVPRGLKEKAKKKVEEEIQLPAKKRGPGRPKNIGKALMRN
jgi:hypothetical protein